MSSRGLPVTGQPKRDRSEAKKPSMAKWLRTLTVTELPLK